MNKVCLFLLSLVISVVSGISEALPSPQTPLEVLQRVLPPSISLRPKLSLRENLMTIFVELATYARTTSARPDSNNLRPGWSAAQDQRLIETLASFPEIVTAEPIEPMITYFNYRIKKSLLVRPFDLWNHYSALSRLFPQRQFWLNYYEQVLLDSKVDWNQVGNTEWVAGVLFPALKEPRDARHSETLATPVVLPWNATFLFNLLSFVGSQKLTIPKVAVPAATSGTSTSSASEEPPPNPQIMAQALLRAYEAVDTVFNFTDPRLKSISKNHRSELEQRYFEFLKDLVLELKQQPFIANLSLKSPFASLRLESVTLAAFILATQEHRMYINIESPRVKEFLSRHDAATQWLNRTFASGNHETRYQLAMNTVIYLRTLISLKTHLTNTPDIISKGRWINPKQFQQGLEILWYEELEKAHLEALRISQLTVYNVSLIDKCYREELQTPTCKLWREKVPLRLVPPTKTNGLKKPTWELRSSVAIKLPPGQIILAENESLNMIAPEIHFHWLSKIQNPSGQVDLQANKISLAWIDVSGETSPPSLPAPAQPAQRPWIKNSQACSPIDYLEGVTSLILPHRPRPVWTGFSMKSPFPDNVFVCRSNILQGNRDVVGDITQMIDLGIAPTPTNAMAPNRAASGGIIKIEINQTQERNPLSLPLLLAMGGDGRQGQMGESSPLCRNGVYQSFKIGLSHHKDWFIKWMAAQERFPHLKLVSRSEYGEHWYGLFEINIPQTSGGRGGDAGAGGQIMLGLPSSSAEGRPQRWFLSAGAPGKGGKAGQCGANAVTDGKEGSVAPNGQLRLIKH